MSAAQPTPQRNGNRRRFGGLLLFCLLGFTHSPAHAGSFDAAMESIRLPDLRRHVGTLASDSLEGREAGARGGKAAGAYLVSELRKLELRPGGEDGSYYQYFEPDYRNVLALVPGRDPELRNEVVVISAHYDHVGYGTRRNSRGPWGLVHNGADDNASGTAGLLEVIEAFAALEPAPRRTVLFAFWDAEEKGLLGSEHWIRRPTLPLRNVRLMINADMIGRLGEQHLVVYGSRTAPGLRELVSRANRGSGLTLAFNWDMERDSDHWPFYQKRVPVLMLHTGKHDDYHRPSDDVDRLNYDGILRTSRLMFQLLFDAAEARELSDFRPASAEENEKLRERLGRPLAESPPRLGMSWSGELARRRIIEVTRVNPDSPAEAAGLRIGDRIEQFGTHAVTDIDDFRGLVMAAESPATLVIQRPDVGRKQLTINLAGRPRSAGIAWRTDEAEPGCVIIQRVDPGSPAEQAGIHVADRILAVKGKPISSSRGFLRHLDETRPLWLTLERGGRLAEVRLRFPGEAP